MWNQWCPSQSNYLISLYVSYLLTYIYLLPSCVREQVALTISILCMITVILFSLDFLYCNIQWFLSNFFLLHETLVKLYREKEKNLIMTLTQSPAVLHSYPYILLVAKKRREGWGERGALESSDQPKGRQRWQQLSTSTQQQCLRPGQQKKRFSGIFGYCRDFLFVLVSFIFH